MSSSGRDENTVSMHSLRHLGNSKPNAHPEDRLVFETENAYADRLQLLHQTCRKRKLFENAVYRGKTHVTYLYSRKYKFSICKVPKSGSTFWSQVFPILEGGSNFETASLDISRLQVHNMALSTYSISFKSRTRRKSMSVLVSRNPYSRLFSAFLDKSYLPGLPGLNQNILNYIVMQENSSLTCHNKVTFQHFLDYIIHSARNNNTHNSHWAPIFSLCNPCSVNAFIVIKQESFSRDVQYTLKQTGVQEPVRVAILKILNSQRVESTIPGVVRETIQRAANDASIETCPGWLVIARRIWRAFQAQGYIDIKQNIPVKKLQNRSAEAFRASLIDIILEYIQAYPLSSGRSKWQREQVLQDAYKNIRNETIYWIQQVYKQDFELFGYSYTPPGGQSSL